MANKTYGRVRMTFTGGPMAGTEWNMRGEVKLMNLGGSIGTTGNLNGTMSKTFEPKPVTADITGERPANFTQAQFLGDHDVILEEVDLGVTHFFSNAALEGDPEQSAKSGDLSGLKIACAFRDYRKA